MFLFVSQAYASDGVLAINNVCNNFGCFSGDTAGFPITITNSGSYILTSNLVSSSTTINIIEVNANNVTIDLNGFSIIGPQTCTGGGGTLNCPLTTMTAKGVVSPTINYNTVVKNGIVAGFGTGINFGSNLNTNGNVVDDVIFRYNNQGVEGSGSVVNNASFVKNLSAFHGTRIFVNNSYFYANKYTSFFGSINSTCSNVYIDANDATNSCARFTNESTCNNTVCP